MDKKICTIIVTYNRAEYLLKLLRALTEQSVKIDTILIFDNCSTDATNEVLKKYGYIDNDVFGENNIKHFENIRFIYYRNNENTGGAGGFASAFKIALTLDSDYMWVMDDDVLPEKSCLETLLKYNDGECKLCIPNRSDSRYHDTAIIDCNFTNPFMVLWNRKIRCTDFYQDDYINVVEMPFEGPLFDTQLVRKIGIPDRNYFIIYDDTDYAHRSLEYTDIRFIPSAVLHKQIVPAEGSGEYNWKDYYSIRNSVLYYKKYGSNFGVRYLSPIVTWMYLLPRYVVKRKFKNIRIMAKAVLDGYLNKKGKTVLPGQF